MSTLPKLETLPDPDEVIEEHGPDEAVAGHEPAGVTYLHDYRDRQRPVARLGDIATGEVPVVDAEDTEELPILYYEDWQRVEEARNDQNAFEKLLGEYTGLIYYISNHHYLPDGSTDDLEQELRLGFYKAVKGYDGRSMSFDNFADLCIKRRLASVIKFANRLKHRPLNESMSLSYTNEERDDGVGDNLMRVSYSAGDNLADEGRLPEDIVIGDEAFERLIRFISSELSSLEQSVLRMFMESGSYNGETYQTMAEQLGVDAKAVDNALGRARRKISRHLDRQENGDQTLVDVTSNKDRSLKDIAMAYEAFVGPNVLSSLLTDLERDALRLHVDEGKSYKTAAEELDVTEKDIYNALRRAKFQISGHLEAIEAFEYT